MSDGPPPKTVWTWYRGLRGTRFKPVQEDLLPVSKASSVCWSTAWTRRTVSYLLQLSWLRLEVLVDSTDAHVRQKQSVRGEKVCCCSLRLFLGGRPSVLLCRCSPALSAPETSLQRASGVCCPPNTMRTTVLLQPARGNSGSRPEGSLGSGPGDPCLQLVDCG